MKQPPALGVMGPVFKDALPDATDCRTLTLKALSRFRAFNTDTESPSTDAESPGIRVIGGQLMNM